MKNFTKLIGIIALVAIIGFSFAALSLTGCSNGDDGTTPPTDTGTTPNPDDGKKPSGDKTPITVANISITAPAKGATPAAAVFNEEQERFTEGTVTWLPNDNPFKGNTVYTASVTLTAKSGFTFTGLTSNNAKINGDPATVSDNTGETIKLSRTFAETSNKIVSGIAIKTQPTKLIYDHGDSLDLSGLAVTLTYDDGTPEDVTASGFTAKNIATDPGHGIPLERWTYNGQPITITYGSLTPLTTNNLTVNPAPVSSLTIDAISEQTYTGSEIKPTLSIKYPVTSGTARILVLGTDYSVSFSNNTYVGIATVTITGIGDYSGSRSVNFTINKATPTITTLPTAEEITVGAALSTSALSGGVATTAGTFAWTAPATVPPLGTNTYGVTFTPTDTANYNTVTGNVSITVTPVSHVHDWGVGWIVTTPATYFTAGEETRTCSIDGTTETRAIDQLPIVTATDWNAATTAIKNGGNDKTYDINVTGNFSIPGYVSSPTFGNVNGLTVNIRGAGTITLAADSTGSLLYIIDFGGGQQTVSLKDTHLVGHSTNNTSLVFLGTINDKNVTFNMTGGTISGNTASDGGGVYVVGNNATFNMTGGTISDNTATDGGGGVYNGGTFNMTGGTISGNTASDGGGVYNGGTFNMTGGTISDNTATGTNSGNGGGGVYVFYLATFNMTSGTISGNNAYMGGGVSNNFGTITITGGTITGNTSTPASNGNGGRGGGVYSTGTGSTFNLGGMDFITGNTANAATYPGNQVYSSSTLLINGSAPDDSLKHPIASNTYLW